MTASRICWARDVLLLSLWLCAVQLDGALQAASRSMSFLCPATGLDRLNVIGRVQSLSAAVQTTSTPALFVFILGLGQLIACQVIAYFRQHVGWAPMVIRRVSFNQRVWRVPTNVFLELIEKCLWVEDTLKCSQRQRREFQITCVIINNNQSAVAQ